MIDQRDKPPSKRTPKTTGPLVELFAERFRKLSPELLGDALRLAVIAPGRPAYKAIDELTAARFIDPKNQTLDFTLLNWAAVKAKLQRPVEMVD